MTQFCTFRRCTLRRYSRCSTSRCTRCPPPLTLPCRRTSSKSYRSSQIAARATYKRAGERAKKARAGGSQPWSRSSSNIRREAHLFASEASPRLPPARTPLARRAASPAPSSPLRVRKPTGPASASASRRRLRGSLRASARAAGCFSSRRRRSCSSSCCCYFYYFQHHYYCYYDHN